MSVKFQMTMPEDLAARLKRTAADHNVPMAEFIRDSMERVLDEIELSSSPEDPLAFMRGRVKDEDPTLSTRVDEVVYG